SFSLKYNGKPVQIRAFTDPTDGGQTFSWRPTGSGFGAAISNDLGLGISTKQVKTSGATVSPPTYAYQYSIRTPDGGSHVLGQVGSNTSTNFETLDATGMKWIQSSG